MLALCSLILNIHSAYAGKPERETGIVAHRGFWNCEEAGFRGSEFDVNMTADSILLVYHDSEIEGRKRDKRGGLFTLHEKWYSQARAYGMSVNTWTVNKKNDMKKMLELGVDYITTDEPLLAREVLKELGYGELK